jgi:DNA-binding Lrp family transcriptional regulator
MIPKNSKIVSRIADFIKYDTLVLKLKQIFLTKEEKERRVIDLYYNQGKTFRDIAKEIRMSPNAITAILKKEEERNNSTVTNNQQQSSSFAAKAYELFSIGKTPVEVAIELNLKEPEVTKLFIEYCKLKRLHKLYLVYKELGDNDIGYFVKLCKLAKNEGLGIEQVVKLLQLVDENNPFALIQLEKRREWLIDKIHQLDMQIEISKSYLYRSTMK